MAFVKTIASWLVLFIILLIAGGGISLIRYGIFAGAWWAIGLGIVIAVLATSYLGGFIYYRDKKNGRVKRPDLFRNSPPKKQD